MANPRNYAKELDKVIERLGESGEGRRKVLLHSCCAPCSSYVMEYLREYFDLTVFYYNPNITEAEEYRKRAEEQKRLIAEYNRQTDKGDFAGMHSSRSAGRIHILEGEYEPERFYGLAKGLETCPEGGERCFRCYSMKAEEKGKVYEDSLLFNYIFGRGVADVAHMVAVRSQMETAGHFDSDKEIDVATFYYRYSGVPQKYLTVKYRLEDLIKWAYLYDGQG